MPATLHVAASAWSDAGIKFGNSLGAIAGFLGILLLIFFAAGPPAGSPSRSRCW
ncbi:hypothetical protein ACFQ0T_12415 [Kitasatospora gansuensis]